MELINRPLDQYRSKEGETVERSEEDQIVRNIFEFILPERFVIGTVGVPGEREFFLQVKGISGGVNRIASFKLEKNQAAALAERSLQLLKELRLNQSLPRVDLAPLEMPIEPEFTLGVMTLTWLDKESLFNFEAQAIIEESSGEIFEEMLDDESPEAPPLLRLHVKPDDLQLFAKRTELVVSAGRQPCVFCGGPVNPGGHLCPRSNGFRRQV